MRAVGWLSCGMLMLSTAAAAQEDQAAGLFTEARALPLVSQSLKVVIARGEAELTLTQLFLNDGAERGQADYHLHVPQGATVTAFGFWNDGRFLRAELRDKDDAQGRHQRAALEGRATGLLTQEGLIHSFSVYPLAAGEQKKVQTKLRVPLERQLGRTHLRLPVDAFLGQPGPTSTVLVDLISDTPLASVDVPGLRPAVLARSERRAHLGFTTRHAVDVVWSEEGPPLMTAAEAVPLAEGDVGIGVQIALNVADTWRTPYRAVHVLVDASYSMRRRGRALETLLARMRRAAKAPVHVHAVGEAQLEWPETLSAAEIVARVQEGEAGHGADWAGFAALLDRLGCAAVDVRCAVVTDPQLDGLAQAGGAGVPILLLADVHELAYFAGATPGQAEVYVAGVDPEARVLAMADRVVLPVLEVRGLHQDGESLRLLGHQTRRVAEGGLLRLFARSHSRGSVTLDATIDGRTLRREMALVPVEPATPAGNGVRRGVYREILAEWMERYLRTPDSELKKQIVDTSVREGIPVALTALQVDAPRPEAVAAASPAVSGGSASGGLMETIEVVGVSPVLHTDSATVAEVITGSTAVALPLNGRNFAQLTLLTPGVVAADLELFALPGAIPEGRPYVNGQRGAGNSFVLDGVGLNEPVDNVVAYAPSLEALAELRVETSNYGAENGDVAGVLVNGLTKSGGNDIHGNATEFWRDGRLGANSWANNRSRAAKPGLAQHIFGATLGGPVRRNRLFFFVDYQGTRIDQSGAATASVAPLSWRSGDFSELLPSGVQIRDPLTGLPFPGNVIPASRVSPAARALLAETARYPLPNREGSVGNFVGQQHRTTRNDQADVRLDAHFGTKDTVFVRFSFGDREGRDQEKPFPLLTADTEALASRNLAIGWVRAQSPTLANDLRLGVNRVALDRTTADWAGLGAFDARLGIPGVQARPGLSRLDWTSSGIDAIGSPLPSSRGRSTTYEFSDKVSIARGRHVLGIGAQWWHARMQRSETGPGGLLGGFTFSGRFTGFAFSDFLLDQVAQKALGGAAAPWTQSQERLGLFVQDDFRLSYTLALNLGLRWEYTSPLRETDARELTYDLASGRAVFPRELPAAACAAYAAGCVRRASGSLYDVSHAGFAPRAGLAWTVGDDSVVRAAYGIVQQLHGPGATDRLPQQPPFAPLDLRRFFTAAAGSLATGFTDPAFVTAPTLGAGQLRTFQQDVAPELTQQWNVFLERRLGYDTSIAVGYVGSRSSRLLSVHDANQPLPGVGDPAAWPEAEARRPHAAQMPAAAAILETRADGSARYDGLHVNLRRRRANGLELALSYALGRALQDGAVSAIGDPSGTRGEQDSRHPEADSGPAFFDARHTLTVSAAYDLPWGHGRAHGSDWGGLAQGLLGGWHVSLIFSARSGLPLTVNDGWNVRSLQPSLLRERPDRGPGDVQGSFDWANPSSRWLDPAAFLEAAPGTFGTSGVGIARGPGFYNLDLGLEKEIRLGGSRTLTLGSHAFNVLNHPNKGTPNTDWSDRVHFGTITSTANGARTVEIVGKLGW